MSVSKRAQDELAATFATELGDRVQSLDGLLLQLESGDDRKSALSELRRELHSLKGGARAAGAVEIARLLTELRNILEAGDGR